MQEIALQNQGCPNGRTSYGGHGGPGISSLQVRAGYLDELNEYVHYTTNMLVNSRASLFVIYPGLNYQSPVGTRSMFAAGTELGDDDPFSGAINFGIFVNETGGKLFYNRNDVNTEIEESEELASEYYTLTYQPPEGNVDVRFRRIRVTSRNPDLRVVTKAGYFAMDKEAAVGDRPQAPVNIAEAGQVDYSVRDAQGHNRRYCAPSRRRHGGVHCGPEPAKPGVAVCWRTHEQS